MEFLDKLDNEKTHSKVEILKQICRDAAPLVNLFQSKEDYKQELIRKLEKKNLQNCAKRKKKLKKLRNIRSILTMRYLSQQSPMRATLPILLEGIWIY